MMMLCSDIKVKETTMVKPEKKTPRQSIPLTEMDQLYDLRKNTCLYFYKHNGASNFFDLALLKEALAKVLVPYYPVAGRLRHKDGDEHRLEIDCNEKGVLLIVAETTFAIDDLGDFTASPLLSKLSAPPADYSAGISSFPLVAVQVTYFRCGGVCLCVSGEHYAFDGHSAFNFTHAWSEVARGQSHLTTPPVFDRTLLSPRDPHRVVFNHSDEYRLMSSDKYRQTSHQITDEKPKVITVKITRDEINKLKAMAKEDGNTVNFSTFSLLGGLIWKCASIARELPEDQETKFYFSANGRSRLQPRLPPGYFGNVVFQTLAVALAGDLQSKSLWYAVNRIHETLMKLDNDYFRSVIDFLKVHPNTKRHSFEVCRSPNLGITSWARFSIHDTDFGWGKPFHTGHCGILSDEGRAWILDDGADGNLSVMISLQSDYLEAFQKLFYNCVKTN